MIVEFDLFMFPNASDIALVAHGNVAVIASQYHLCAFGDNIAIADTGIDRGLCTAIADGLDLLNGIGNLHEPTAAGE